MTFMIFPIFLSVAVLICIGVGVAAMIKKGRKQEARKDEDSTV